MTQCRHRWSSSSPSALTMQRFCTKLRSLTSFAYPPRLLQPPPHLLHHQYLHSAAAVVPASVSAKWSSVGSLLNPSSSLSHPVHFHPLLHSSQLPLSLVHVRHVSSRERWKRRKPMTPVKSKLKKYKIKFYSSYKSRFRPLNDGTIRRWREGKLHNAHLKSSKAKRRLRRPSIVPAAYATVMKKLGFCA